MTQTLQQILITLDHPDDFDGWRAAARDLALRGMPPERVVWSVGSGQHDLFGEESVSLAQTRSTLRVPSAFIALGQSVICHRDPERFALLYDLLTRLQSHAHLLDDAADPVVNRVAGLARVVRRDIHKMRAFVRFREVIDAEGPRFIAWFEPDHYIVRTNAAFFVRRFGAMRWTILTPEVTIDWDGNTLREGPGAQRNDAPDGDPVEQLWKRYYVSIFNPARVKIGAMLKEMPKRYWKNMPETAQIPALIANAQAREQVMLTGDSIKSDVTDIAALALEASSCQRCPLWKGATQTVFGEGPPDARIMIVGEQPGDNEDIVGRAFIGPAGQMLDRALAEAQIDRSAVYLTNAVKHFKYEQRGKRRIHQKPSVGEISACRWWVDQERLMVRPQLIIALGATAARSLTARAVKIGEARKSPIILADGTPCHVTVHPSYLLRISDPETSEREYANFVADLRAANAAVSIT